MIKLIASDMDGTLLTPSGQVPEEFFDIFEKLKEKNIEFVVASGRPHKTLYENFKPISDKLLYISDNGAVVSEGSNVLSVELIPEDVIKKVYEVCSDIKNTRLVVCGLKSAYHLPCDGEMLKEIDKYYLHKTVVNSYDEIDDKIFKISICDMDSALENSFPIADKHFSKILKTVVAGKAWVDFTNLGVNKGTAIEKFQKEKGITIDETMAFGDYFNDVELLQKAKYSYVMEDALEEMKTYGNFICKSNKENGVLQVLNDVLNNEIK